MSVATDHPQAPIFGCKREMSGMWVVYKLANGAQWCMCPTERRARLIAAALNARVA